MTEYLVEELDLSNRNLYTLPDLSLYTNLKILKCTDNKISFLDNLPSGLTTLYCEYNNISSLDNLPSELTYLSCGDNKISSLDNLPSELKELYCYNNLFIYNFESTLENIRKYNSQKT